MQPPVSSREQRQVGLAVAAQHARVDLHAVDPARLRQHARLRLDPLGGEHAAAGGEARLERQPLEVARELLDGVDRGHALDLHRHPAVVGVAAHEVHGPDVGGPLAAHEPKPLTAALRRIGQQLLQLALHALLLQRGGLTHVVGHVGEHLLDADLEPVLARAGALADHDQPGLLLDDGGRRHPVLGLEAAGVGVDHHGAVGLEHEQPQRLGQHGGQAAGVADLAAGDDQAHEPRLGPAPDAGSSASTGSPRGRSRAVGRNLGGQ